MSMPNKVPLFAFLEVDRRSRGWGSPVSLVKAGAFPLLSGLVLLVWCIHGITTQEANRPPTIYLVLFSILCIAMLHIGLGFAFLVAVVRGWLPAAFAVVGRRRTRIVQGGVIPRFVSFGAISGEYTVARKLSPIGASYWDVQRGTGATLHLAVLDNNAVSEDDDHRLVANFERLSAAETAVRLPR